MSDTGAFHLAFLAGVQSANFGWHVTFGCYVTFVIFSRESHEMANPQVRLEAK